jgi:hypothetical protein
MEKQFTVNPQIGRARYSISAQDGIKTHSDGSAFWDIEIFNNKLSLIKAIRRYEINGYKLK